MYAPSRNYMERGTDYHNRLDQLSNTVSTIIVRIHMWIYIYSHCMWKPLFKAFRHHEDLWKQILIAGISFTLLY